MARCLPPCCGWERLLQPVHLASAAALVHLCARRVVVKLGPRCEMGDLLPKESDGWKVAQSGHEFAVWERVAK